MTHRSQHLDVTAAQISPELQACQLRNDSLGFTDSLKTLLHSLQHPEAALGTLQAVHAHLCSEAFPQEGEDFREAVLADLFGIIIAFTSEQSAVGAISRHMLAFIIDVLSPREVATMVADCLSRAG